MQTAWDVPTATPLATNELLIVDGVTSALPNATPGSGEVTNDTAQDSTESDNGSVGYYVHVGSMANELSEEIGNMTIADLGSGVEGFGINDVSQINISLEITGDACWLEVREDSRRGSKIKLAKEVFQLGETLELYSREALFLKLGNPSAVKMTVNGQSINTGSETKPRTFGFQITPETIGEVQ